MSVILTCFLYCTTVKHWQKHKTLNVHHNVSDLLILRQVVVQFLQFSAVWVQLMKILTVSPTHASESAACWLRDPLTEEPSIKGWITPTLTPQTTAVMSCLSSCWLGASDRDPCSCPGYLMEIHREEEEKARNSTHALVHCYFNSLYSYMLTKLQRAMSQPCLYSRHTK